ncbi:MAG: capsule assembly Wzi family protein [Steroidobacteraceae bacterium]
MSLRMPLWAASLAATLLCASVAHAAASQVWAEVGDGRMRADLELLADSGVIDLPLNDWPIPVADIEHEMGKVDRAKLTDPSLQAAYDRIQTTLQPDSASGLHLTQEELAAGERGLLRDYDTPSRADGGATAEVADYGDRWAVELNMNYAISPQDGQPFRLDDSNLTARFGNWLVSLNTLDKWWGPSYESSLILSNNARPMPALELDRATSAPIDLPILRWLGPWRFIMYVATAEEHRPDVDDSLFFGNRISWRPLRFLEIGLSRTTQFCGSGRNCGLTTWRNVLLGNDTTQYASVADKPGHAEAGYEARLNSPWQAVPLALYTQIIGNDEINHLPARLMKQYGIESWLDLNNGDTIKGFAEYSDSTCGAGRIVPQYAECAYENTIFFAGYTYRRLNIADSAGPNAILRTLGLRWDRSGGDEWQLKIQSGHFDRGNLVNIYNVVSPSGSSLYDSGQVEFRRPLFGGDISVQLGAERQTPAEAISSGGFGYITWSKAL